MMTLPEFRDLVNSSRAYLRDEISIVALHGFVANCYQLAILSGVGRKIVDLLDEYRYLCNRVWNEWGIHTDGYNKEDLKQWIIASFLDDDDKSYQCFKSGRSSLKCP